MMSPYRNEIHECPNLLMLQPAGKERQGVALTSFDFVSFAVKGCGGRKVDGIRQGLPPVF